MRWVFEGNRSIDEVRLFQQMRPYPGNAPVMRAVPLGFLPDELIDSYAVINADATHPHPKARAASMLVARAAKYMIIEKGDPGRIVAHCAGFVQGLDKETDRYLTVIEQLPGPEIISEMDLEALLGPQPIEQPRFPAGINGLPSDAMLTAGAVLWTLKHARTAMEGLKMAVYLGGDVDSVAAVSTGILAGRYGTSSIPAFMKNNTEGIDDIQVLAERFYAFYKQ
jgi:ADP-ribosylglycohydrolase